MRISGLCGVAIFISLTVWGHTSLVNGSPTARELDRKAGGSLFARMWRTAACTNEQIKNPCCPSIERNSQGDLLLMSTYEPTKRSSAVLGLAISKDEGKTWSNPRAVYSPANKKAVPTATGTLTRLASGELVAPFAEGDEVRLLVSKDDGGTWKASKAIDCSPLLQAKPHSRLVEHNGELLMSLFGKLPVTDKQAPCSGLLRSRDGGKTWGNFTVIACDRKESKTEFGSTAVYADADGRMLALISVGNQFIYRSTSSDGGKSWSEPDQRLLACNPILVSVGRTLACVNQATAIRGPIRVQFSENLFDSWRCDRTLDFNIRGQYSAAIALDADRLLVVHDRAGIEPVVPNIYPPPDEGGIEVAMMQRNPNAPALPETLIPPEKRDNWVWEQTVTSSIEKGFGHLAQKPDGTTLYSLSGIYENSQTGIYASTDGGRTFEEVAKAPRSGLFGVLRSGRWLIAAWEENISFAVPNTDPPRVASSDGYAYFSGDIGSQFIFKLWIYYSDDQGKTWQGSNKPIDINPLVWVLPYGRFIEQDDGTVVMTVYGCFSDRDTWYRKDCSGIFRSTDGGKTWGDFSVVAYDHDSKPSDPIEFNRESAFNEMDIQPMPDGTWVAVMRGTWPSSRGIVPSSVSFSKDRGRTWTKPEYAFMKGVPDLALLPDGGLACSTAGNMVHFSYDGGHTWSREISSRTEHYPCVYVVGKDEDYLFVCDRWKKKRASIWRRIPAGSTADTSAEKRFHGKIEKDVIHIRNPKLLERPIPVERIAVGEKGYYKPCIAKLPNDELLLTAYFAPTKLGRLWRSCDGGRTWKQENAGTKITKEAYFTVLKDGTVFLTSGGGLHRSTDGGKTWATHLIRWQDLPGLTKAPEWLGPAYGVGELHDGTLIFAVSLPQPGGADYLWRSQDKGKTWDKSLRMSFRGGIDPEDLPYGSMFGEAIFWQAPNGDILVPARVIGETLAFPLRGRKPPPVGIDHSEGMALYRSKDGGASWSVEDFGAYYGEMYPSILRLQDGRLLFTFTMRAAIAPQEPPLGVRAVVGKETKEGFEFDFQHDRIMLDTKTPIGQMSGGGFGPTVQLNDGTLVTCYSYAGTGKWGDDDYSCTEVVRWRLP